MGLVYERLFFRFVINNARGIFVVLILFIYQFIVLGKIFNNVPFMYITIKLYLEESK